MNLIDSASLVVTPNGYKASKLYSIIPSDGTGDMTFARTGDTATRVNSSGLIAPINANIPRLDYTGGGCPKLLLEPQRTNLLLRSEEFDNASWTKSGAGTGTAPAITSNAAISPDGAMDADKIDLACPATGSSNWSWVYQNFSATSGLSYTFTIYLKAATPSDVGKQIRFGYISYNNITLTADWTRYTSTAVAPSASSFSAGFRLRGSETTDTTASLFAYGAQLEVGAYATSYIPTTTASVTRNADLASKTGISSLIGQTEGTLFVNANISNFSEARRGIVLFADANNFITLRISSSNDLQFLVFESGAIKANFTIANPQGNVKMALAYKANDFAAYLNGTLVGTDTSGTVPATSGFYLGYDPSGTNQLAGSVNQALLFKTRLSNADLATLTTL